jgi:multiple sugar transport system substrate-binding protein
MLLMFMLVTTTVLTACGKSNEPSKTAEPKPSEKASEKPSEQPSDKPKETVVLKWGTWQSEEEVQRIIKAFEATHPNIKIEQEKAVTWPWNEKLAAAAAAGIMPDVTWTFGVPTAAANGWLEDLTPYLQTDPDYKQGKTFKNLDATANYDGKQYALPHSLFMFAMFLNLDLFEKENVKVPPMNWSIDEFRNDAQALTKFNDHQFGLRTAKPMRETLASSFDPNLGWNTWDGSKFNFTSPAFKDTYDFVNKLMVTDKVAAESYKEEERTQWYGKDKDPWILGKLGMVYDGTWALAGNAKNAKFKWDVRPLPGVKGQRIPLITDYVGISKSSKHKKEAFEFVKWLTFSKEGWMERMKPEWPLGSIPLINDPDVWNAYLNRSDMPPGMKELVKMIPNGIVDPIKWLPGYLDALKIYGDSFKQVEEGKAKFEDIAPDMEKRMNNAYQDAAKKLKEAAK